ncbi:MAG TPA: hypothetical protein VMB19_13790 [Silvibacterium sp.]|nr:hypothetical protein [Silvibacterium sp.]
MKPTESVLEIRRTPFDFGLSEAQEQRALRLHADSIVSRIPAA